MSAILNSLNAHNLLIFQPILMILVSKFMVYRALSDKTYLLLGLLSPLIIRAYNKSTCTSSRSSKWKHAVDKNTYNDRAKRPPAFLKS